MKYNIKQLRRMSKIQAAAPSVASDVPEAGRPMTAVIRVKEPFYVPQGVRVCARVNPVMFTGEAPERILDKLRLDPKIQDISSSRPRQLIA